VKRVSFNAALRSPVLWFSISAVILALVVATTGPPMPPLAVQRGIGALYRHKYKEALELLTPYAEGGDTTAQFTLATMSSSGWGVTRSDSEAFKWYRRAANGGSRLAQVGIFYKNSRTVTKDDAEAAKWFRLAAERGEAEAQYDLGIMYETGRGVPQDIHEAASWYRKSAAQEDAQAQNNLALLYMRGDGVQQDFAEARKWFGEAADRANAQAMIHLAEIYLNGQGVAPDRIEAYKWYVIASRYCDMLMRKSCPEITRDGDSFKAGLTPDDIRTATLQAQNWKPKFAWVDAR